MFLNFNVARMYGFYYIDFSIYLISYVIYNIITVKYLDASNVFFATIVMLTIIGVFIFGVVGSVLAKPFNTFYDIARVFWPYYDLTIFIIFSIRVNYMNVKGYLSFDKDLAKSEYSKLLLYNIFLIPTLIVVAFIVTGLNINLSLSLVLALIVIRNIIEYQGFKSFETMKNHNRQCILKRS